ncbi:PAS domain-containing protein [Caenimonas koreensis DSM 17982]|uniref:histidine kinase n=2 Tax=Caenimonas TaxID=763439 RepID=A0A844B9A6_9BURK|nr:PAS domain-containing protein [Caenimonas koreensis DSM 17982]
MVWRGRMPEFRRTGFPAAPSPVPSFTPVRVFAVLTLVSGLLIGLALYGLRAEALRSGEVLTRSLSQVIAEQTGRTLQSVDERLQLAASGLDALESQGTLGEATARTLLREHLRDLPFVRAIWVLDMQGRIRLDSDEGNIGLALGDRDYFRVFQEKPSTGFFIGTVIRSRSVGSWLMSAARPWRDADGRIKGVIVAAVEPPYFDKVWREIDLGADGAIALYSRDGILMMRSPLAAAELGQDMSRQALFTSYLPANPTSGSFVARSVVDSVERVFAYRALSGFDQLLVVVGSGYEALLAPWRRFAGLTAMVWLAAILACGVLVAKLERQASRRREDDLRFRQMAQAMPQIVFITDKLGRLQFVNDRWAEATGHPVEDAMGTGWAELIHPEDRAESQAILAEMIRTGVPMEREQRLLHHDGVYRWRLLRAVPFRGDDGRIQAWFGTSTDVEELKRAEERLRVQAGLLTMAGRLARLGGWMVDARTQSIYWSDEASALLDMAPGSSPTLDEIFALMRPETKEIATTAVQRCIESGTPFDVEVEMVTATGRPVWVRSIGQAVRDRTGTIVRIEGAQQDITQRVKLLEEVRDLNASLEEKIALRTAELAKQEALFRALAEQAPLPIWTCDDRGCITFFSRAWYELVGGEPPKWQLSEWIELVHPDDRAPMIENWRHSSHMGQLYAGERRILASNGTYHTMSYRATPVRDADGKIAFWVGVESDITELKAVESALRLSNHELESFSYSISHDLRSPLQRVASFSQLLAEQVEEVPSSKAQHYLSRIRASVDHMTQLIDGLLALSHVAQVELGKVSIDLSVMAQEILDRLQAEHPERVVVTRVEPAMRVWADRALIRSVMENLLGNAWKFSSQRGQAEITVGGSVERGEYFVRDNGAGFDMAYSAKLFGTFQRMHSDAEFEGTGIGLATAKRIILRHGGQIWAHAEPGRGATFFFTLPAGPA